MIIILLIPSQASATNWTKTDIALETTYQVLNLIDLKQTQQIYRNQDRYYEVNPFLRSNMRQDTIISYFMVLGIGHFLISHVLPSPYRTAWQSITIIIQLPVITNNYQIGLTCIF